MFCPNCGSKMNDGASFCSNCGWKAESSSTTNVKTNNAKSIKPIILVVLSIVVFILVIAIFLRGNLNKTSTPKYMYVYLSDDNTVLHFTSKSEKGKLINIVENESGKYWWDGRDDIFRSEEDTRKNGEVYTKIITDDIKKIVIDDKIIPYSCYGLFAEFHYCESIDNMKNIDTSNCENFSYMFGGCYRLKNIDCEYINTKQCRNAKGMFAGCEFVEKFDLTKCSFYNLENADGMFFDCMNLSQIKFPNEKIENIKNVKGMFTFCENLVEIDLSSLNLINVLDFDSMFSECKKLKSVKFNDTAYENIINYMKEKSITKYASGIYDAVFISCESLKTLSFGDKSIEYKKIIDDLKIITINNENFQKYFDIDIETLMYSYFDISISPKYEYKECKFVDTYIDFDFHFTLQLHSGTNHLTAGDYIQTERININEDGSYHGECSYNKDTIMDKYDTNANLYYTSNYYEIKDVNGKIELY